MPTLLGLAFDGSPLDSDSSFCGGCLPLLLLGWVNCSENSEEDSSPFPGTSHLLRLGPSRSNLFFSPFRRCCCLVAKSCLTLCEPLGLCPSRLLCGFSEYWSGLPFPPPRDLPDPGIKAASPALAGGFSTAEPPRKPSSDPVPPFYWGPVLLQGT